MTVFLALKGESRFPAWSQAVIHPIQNMYGRHRGNICGKVCLGTNSLAKIHKFVSSDLVALVFSVLIDPEIRSDRAVFADSVSPIVTLGKATAGPAQNRRFYGTKHFYNIFSEALDVGNIGILADPKAVIKYAADVLGELSVDVGVNRALRLIKKDSQVLQLILDTRTYSYNDFWSTGGILGGLQTQLEAGSTDIAHVFEAARDEVNASVQRKLERLQRLG